MGDLNSSILQWLETSGRALELLRVAQTLQQIGHADVQPAFNYQDTVTGRVRESNVVASFAWTGMENVPCTITLAAECKSSTKHPWVAFLSDGPPERRPGLEEWAVFRSRASRRHHLAADKHVGGPSSFHDEPRRVACRGGPG